MGISTFGGISSSTSSDGNIIGELINVPTNFSQTGYVDAGSTFSATQYPALAAITPPAFAADLWVSNNVPSTIPVRCTQAAGTAGAANPTVGSPIQTVTFGGEFFVFFAKGQVFRTTGGNISSLAYLTTITTPSGSTVAQAIVANTSIYVSFTTSLQMSVFSEISLTTVAYSTLPTIVAAGVWNVTYGNGVYMGFRPAASVTPYFSTDGLTWTAVPSYAATSAVIIGIEWNGTNWLLASNSGVHASSTTAVTGASWTAITSGFTQSMSLMRYNPVLNLYVTVPTSGNGIYTSSTGLAGSWTSRRAASATLAYLDISSTGYMTMPAATAGAAMWCYASSDGITWNVVTAGTGASVVQTLNTTAPTYGAVTSFPFMRSFGSTQIVIGLYGNYGVTYTSAGQWNYCTSTNSWGTLSSPTAMFMTNGAPTIYPPVYLTGNQNGLIMEFNAPGNKPTWTAGVSTNGGVAPSEVLSSPLKGPYYVTTANGGQTWNTPAQLPMPVSQNVPVTWKGGFATGSRYVVLCTVVSTIYIMTSPDGVTWTSYVTPSASTNCIIVGESIYLGSFVSTNYGATWSPTAGTFAYYMNGNFVSIASGSGTFISASNMLAGSATASSVPTLTNLGFASTAWCTGPKGSIITLWSSVSPYSTTNFLFSPDNGASWTLRTFPFAINPTAAFFYNGYFVVFYSPSAYLYSTDGNSWLQGNMPGNAAFQNYWALQGSSSNAAPLLAGASGTYVTPDTTTYRVPYTAPFTAGSKWTIKAQ